MDDPQALTKKISKSLRLCQQTIFPPVMGKLLHEAMQPDPDLQKIADIIRLDPPLTAMVLALANSPYYKLSSPVSGIQRAAVVLGNKELLKIVLFVSFQNRLKSFSTSRESGLISSWNATVWAATAAEQLARHLDPAHTSQAYLCTLLKDLSRILLATTDSLPFTLKELATFSPQQAAVEKRMWGTTHAHLTKELLDQWSLPDICTEGILAHHDVDHLDQHPPLVQAVILATRWAEVEFQHKGDPRPALQFTLLAQKILGIDEDGFEILRTQVTETFRSMCDILEIPQVKIWERFFDHSIKTMQHLFFLSIDIRNIPHGIPSVAKSIGMHLNLYWGIDNWDMALISPFSSNWTFFHNIRANDRCREIPANTPFPWEHRGPIIDIWDEGRKIGAFRLAKKDSSLGKDKDLDLYFRFVGQNYALYLQDHARMESKARTLDTIPIGVVRLDRDGYILQPNTHFQSIYPVPEKLPGKHFSAALAEGFGYPKDPDLDRYLAGKKSDDFSRIFCPLGVEPTTGESCIYFTITRQVEESGIEHIALVEDISRVRSIEFDILKQRTFLHNLVASMQDIVMTLDSSGKISYVSPNGSSSWRGKNFFHIATPDSNAGISWEPSILGHAPSPIEISMDWDGRSTKRTFEMVISELSRSPQQYLIVGRDVSQIRRLEKQLRHQATYDSLTRVFNRYQFNIALAEETKKCVRTGRSLGLIFFDVDNFKGFNDKYGHQAGDKVLTTIGAILKQNTRQGMDTPCRYGGDEFVVVATEITPGALENLAVRIKKNFNKYFGKDIFLSMGLALFNQQETPEKFLLRADKASYSAKTHGGNAIVFAD